MDVIYIFQFDIISWNFEKDILFKVPTDDEKNILFKVLTNDVKKLIGLCEEIFL